MSGRIRRLLRTVPSGGIDLAQVMALATGPVGTSPVGGLSPAAALARHLLQERLGQAVAERCLVLGPGRLVQAATLPVACRSAALPDGDGASEAVDLTGLDWLVVGDALAATNDPPGVLAGLVAGLAPAAPLRLLVVLPGTALLPDDEPPVPRRWLFSRASAEAMAAAVLPGRAASVVTLGNVLAASTELLGQSADRLWPDELAAHDGEYPMVVALEARLGGG